MDGSQGPEQEPAVVALRRPPVRRSTAQSLHRVRAVGASSTATPVRGTADPLLSAVEEAQPRGCYAASVVAWTASSRLTFSHILRAPVQPVRCVVRAGNEPAVGCSDSPLASPTPRVDFDLAFEDHCTCVCFGASAS